MLVRLARPFGRASCGTLGVVAAAPRARSFASASNARILRTDVKDILFHFALEEYLLQSAELKGPVMYLWRPAPVVTIGRHQNPWKECVLERLEADGVGIVRRRSGGGAIFQDPGGSVFTFLGPSDTFSIDTNFDVVLGALNRFGIAAERQGRNDLTVGGKKMSGSAFKHVPSTDTRGGVSLHHGTILVEADMKALSRYLTPDKRKLQAKGIASVGARVMNLRDEYPDVNHDALGDAFAAQFREVVGASDVKVETITENDAIASTPEFRKYYDELANKDWRLGRTPEFSHQLDTRIDGVGVFDVHLQVVQGRVQEAVVFSDCLYPDVIEQIMLVFRGAQYGRAGLGAALETLKPIFPEGGPGQTLVAFSDWLLENVDN